MDHYYTLEFLCWVLNIVLRHKPEEDWCKCVCALGLQHHKKSCILPRLQSRSIRHLRPLKERVWAKDIKGRVYGEYGQVGCTVGIKEVIQRAETAAVYININK